MNKKELNLDALADEIIRVFYPTYEQAIPGMRNAIIQKKQRIKQILEYHIKSACEFYLRYRNNPDLFARERLLYRNVIPKLRKEWHNWEEQYDKWLFKLAFRDILEGEGNENL